MDETTRLKEIEERAAIALYANDAQNAWELYSEAASICLKNDLEEDYKRVLSCKSMMATMLQRNEEALLDSISYFMLDQRTEQGYWLAAMSHIKHGKKNLALGYFLKGFKIALEPSLFLVEIVRCLVTLRSTKEKEEFTHLFGQHRDLNVNEITTDTLKRTLQKLNETESWKCLCLLVIGKHPGPKTDFDKLACQCPASHIFVGKMLNKLSRKNKQKFGFQLAIAFLNNGASVKEIENVYETPAVHVGLRMFLETEKDILLLWLFKNFLSEQSMKDRRDVNGNTAVHSLVKSTVEDIKLKQRVLKCLLEYGCSPGLCDMDGKLPKDCITADDPCFQILESTASHIDQTSLNNIIDDWTNAEIIQHANKLFDQSRFNDALESYIKAREMLTSEENDVEIQCNIIECYLNMKDYKRALELCLSVNESSCGPGIEKVNVLRGYALKGLKNWPEAFYAFLNVAIKFQDKGIFEKDIVVNIADTYIEYSTFDDELDTVQVERLCDRMKCYIVWELVKRAYWNVAHRFFKQTAGTGSNSRECAVMIISDLKPICTFAVLSEHRWLSCFITCLIKNGMLEFRNIKYKAQRRKSYKGLHACVMISSVTGDTSLVDLVSKQAKECFQHNEQDSEGNTALHLAVFVYRDLSEHAIAQTVVECLLMNGINPLLKNHESNTARNCIAETNKELSKILLKYETRLIKQISKEEEMNERKRKFEIWKLHEENPQKIDNFKTYVFVKVDETPSEKVNSIYKCDCKFTLQKIKESGNISEEQKIGHLIEVIRKDHRLSTHHKVQHECVSLIANAVSKEDAPEIMKTMLEISEPVYEAYLHELCHLKRWEELHKILKSYRGKLSNSSLQMLARSCSIYTLIEAVDKEETIAELLEIFLEGKNIIIKDDGILVNDLLKRKMFRVLRVLFHHDVDPTLLRIYPGDTAIHAAVCIGFQFEHENFAIFGDFVEMYNRDKMNYKCLNPCQLDDNGDSLVDMISNEPETPRKRKLMETLKDLRVPEKSNVTNDENTTYDYQDEKMSINVKIERLEQHLLDEISKLSPGIFNKSELRPIVKFSSEKTNQQNQSEMECERNETGSSFDEVDLKSFESLPWEIECTSGFKKAINSRHVPVHTKKRAFECIKKLAEGYREPHLCKALHHNGNQDIKLFEIKLDKAVRIIWENAINFSPRCNNMSAVTDIECDVIFSEVIRIWDIVLNHDRIHACVENITESYKQCNIFRLSYSPKENYGIKGSTELELPKLFTKRNTNKLVEFKETERNFYISVNPNVTKFYDVSPDLVSHALKYLNNDVDLPFKVTDLEYLFIKMKFDAPILLLGRSGTGKTTCCIYKLWAIFEEYWRHQETKCSSNSNLAASKHSDGKRMDDSEYSEENQLRQIDPEEGLRQLFVTKNPILCSEAERNFIELRKSSSVEKNFSPSEIKTSYETLQEIGEKGYPLFLTYKQLIELLDVSIGPPFYLANENLVDWSDKNNTEDLAQFHNNDDNFSDFSSEDDEFQSEGPSEKFKSRNKLKFKKHTQRKLLTYEIFERDIWMKIKKSTTCHASLVWTEVRSFIKGSFAALNSSKGHLTLEQYKEIGKKVAPLFQDDRELIYEMFKSYERVKKHSHYIDEGDVTFNLFHRSMDEKSQKYHLMRAAHLFFQCKKAMKAEKCLRIASQYKCLGRFYERTQQMHDAADMYRKAILPFDQSRCLEYLGYFGKAISVLVDNACFDFARASLKKFTQHQKSEDKIPESLDSDSKICAKAADCFGKMQNNAQFLKFAKNIECQNERFVMYLKYNFFDEAFELNWPKGTEDKRVDFYMQCGAVQNALHILKDNTQRNKDKRFQCILIMSQIALHKKDKKNLDEIEEKLKQIIHNHSNSVTVAKAHLLIGQLMHLEQHIGNAFELLQNDRHRGMFVQIECIDWMITKCNLSKGDILEKITQYLEKFLPTAKASEIRLFLNPDSSFGQGRFDAMCAFFDFYYHKGNLFKLYPRQFPLGLKIIEEKQECQQFEIYFDKPALEHYCKTYLKTKFQCWKNKLIAAFAEKRKHFEWLNNIEMMTHFNIISIKAAICLSKLLFCDVKKQCEIFLSDLYGAVFLSTSVSRRCENVSAFLQDRDYGFIRSRIKRNLKENLENINSWNERGIADFIRFLLMAHLLDFKDILGEQLECHISHSDLSISFKHFFDSLVRIELKRAVCEFDHFCYLISKENSIPFPCDLFMLFCEMFLTTAFYIIARSHRRTCWFVVPQIYLDSLSHVENLFLKKISVLKKISHDSKSEPETDFFLKHLVHILCGFSCKLHLLKNKSKKQTEDRILALGFTVLCNLGGILTTPDCTEVESNLAREINKHLKRKGQEKILEAMSEAKFLIDFHKPLHELLNSGEHKLLWCSWDSENGLSHTTEKENHYFKDISIKPETRTAITKAEISTDSKKYEEHYILGENPQLFHEEFPKPKIDGTNICSSIKSSKRKGRKKRNTIHDLEKSGDNASLEKDESTKQRTEDCINDSNEEISTEMSIEDINSQLKTSNDNGAATHEDSDVKKVAFENGAEQNKLFKSGLLDEIKDRNQLGKENSTDCNDNFHDAKRLTDSDEKVKAIGTASCGGNAAVDTNLNQKKLDDGDQLEKNRKMNNSFGHKNLPNDNKDGFPDDKLLTDSVSIMASRDTDNLFTKSAEADETNQQMNKMDLIDRKFDNSYSQNDDKIEDNHYKKNLSINPETILPETIKSIHANDMECSDQHTQWEDDGDESLNDIRYLFKV
ncbi:uncharacterized protein LOC128159600 isoform X4 [Crassostrea angulata]|uniref:uncharacterized protein LOC128159600 isoform X4 n=1 Tax=Magallana angulata TaxID=2784310 RepID=UPI0022B08D47|nr:uncharacterized protein LOC128159600 isoform X4 [Crassostrea angulata]